VILLDTHVLIWLASDPSKLSKKAAAAIRSSVKQGGIAISAITLWELAWLATHGGLRFGGTVEDFVEKISSRTAIRPITVKVAVLANQLPTNYSGDPCDRLIDAPPWPRACLWSPRTATSEAVDNSRRSGE